MEKSKHKLENELKRAERHKDWLRKNLPNTKMEKENQKQIFKLRTAIRCDYQSCNYINYLYKHNTPLRINYKASTLKKNQYLQMMEDDATLNN